MNLLRALVDRSSVLICLSVKLNVLALFQQFFQSFHVHPFFLVFDLPILAGQIVAVDVYYVIFWWWEL